MGLEAKSVRLFDSNSPDPAYRGRVAVLVQLASLLVTGCIIWFANLVPRLRHASFVSLVLEAVGYALLAWVWSAAIALGLYLVMPREEREDMAQIALRTSSVAVWFAPATILLSRFSPAALAAALVLAVSATRLLISQWRQTLPPQPAPSAFSPHVPGNFADCELPPQVSMRDLSRGIAVSLAIQGGVVAFLFHYPLLASALFVLSAALLTAFSVTVGAASAGRPPSLPRSILGAAMTLLLAVGITVGGSPGVLLRGTSWNWGSDPNGSPGILAMWRAVFRKVYYGEQPADGALPVMAAAKPHPPEINPGQAAPPGGYPGVILWPEVKPVTTLIAPLPAFATAPGAAQAVQPFSIPFSGEYWMYRWPYAHPPRESYFQRGSPASLAFSTTDHMPLAMEARHKLDTPIELHCCSKIQLQIWNADRYPGTVALELVVADAEHPGTAPLSLGDALVSSVVDQSKNPILPVHEVLNYSLPARATLTQFDEFRVTFHRARVRSDKSARVEIDRFVLVPRVM
jgi:hypothetical protein